MDVVSILNLDKKMTPEEIDDFLEVLEKEIWFRILEEELPKHIAKSDYTYLANIIAPKNDLGLVVDYVKINFPQIPIEKIIEETTNNVKEEFAKKYQELSKDE